MPDEVGLVDLYASSHKSIKLESNEETQISEEAGFRDFQGFSSTESQTQKGLTISFLLVHLIIFRVYRGVRPF